MRRFLAILVFAIAAGTAAAAGSGVIVAPHIDPPRTPLFHSHDLAAYRLPLFLSVLRARWDPHQGLVSSESLVESALGGMVLALLALLWPRLPRPTLRAIAELAPAGVAGAQWRVPRSTGPPRSALHA